MWGLRGGAGQREGGRTSARVESDERCSKEQSCVSVKEEYGGYDWTGARGEAGSNCGASRPSFIVDRSSELCNRSKSPASTSRP